MTVRRPLSSRRRTCGRAGIVAALVALSLGACGDGGQGAKPAPAVEALLPVQPGLNVIVVSFDALRADALGVYGNERGPSPNIDNFAEDAFVFTEAYSVAPVTPTSFAAAWSGLLPSRVFRGWELRSTATLASRLAATGYRTQAFVNNVHLSPDRGFAQGFDGYDWRRNDPDRQVLRAATEWLEHNHESPFFLWVHFLAPHAPYRHRPEAIHLYRGIPVQRFADSTGHRFAASNPAELSRIRDLYLGEVWEADRIFGELAGSLRSLGLRDSSIVVLTSDHGEEFSEHGGFQHGRLYEEHLRVPLIVRHPAAAGGVTVERVRNLDLTPTLLEAVGRPVEDALDGRVIRRPSSLPPRPVVGISMTGEQRWVSLLSGSRKLIVSCGPPADVEMYHLSNDPAERRDVASSDREGVRDMLRRLQAVVGGDPCSVVAGAVQGRAVTVGLDEESIEALEALGYLD